MARLLIGPTRGSYPRQYLANPYARRVQLAGVGRLGDDSVPDFSTFGTSAGDAAAAEITPPTDFSALTAAQDSSLLPSINSGGSAAAPDDFAALTLAQDKSYLPATSDGSAPQPTNYAKPNTPTPPSNSSVDWTKLITAATTGLVTTGATVATQAIQRKTAAQIAAMQNKSLASKAKAAVSAVASSSALPWVLGGGAVLLIAIFALRRK